jgi:hypothetical protein
MGAFRKLLVGTTTALAMFVGFTAAPAWAEELHVSGSYTGTGTLFAPCTTGIGVDAQGSGDWTALGATSFTLHFCNLFLVETIHDGRFTITTADGTMAGDLTGEIQAFGPGPDFPFHFVMAIVPAQGTGRFAGATGELVLDGAFGIGASQFHGTVDGTIHVPLTPTTKDDCKDGGWRDFTDDEGHPFKNQGECIAFLEHAAA